MTAIADPPRATAPPAPGARGRRVWLALGTLAAVFGIVLLALWTVGALASQRKVVDTALPADGIHEIDVHIGDGNLDLTGVPTTSQVALRFEIDEGLFGTRHSAVRQGDRIDVDAECRGPFSVHCTVNVTARVPADVRLVVHADNGLQTVTGLTGGADLSTDNGDLHLRDLAGPLVIGTDNGDVAATGLRSSSLRLSTDNGASRIRFVGPPQTVTTQSDNGDVTVELPDDDTAYALVTSTDNGSVSTPIRTDPTSGHHITARSDNGDITVRYAAR